MASHYTYSYFRVSKTEDISASAQKYRELRLKALKTSPSSFSSTYDIEAAFTHANWIDRLTVPNREVFICAATRHSNNNDLSSSEGAEWISQVTLRGPLSATDFVLPEASGQPPQRPDEEEERWQMLSLFTLPEHRGKGLGGNLCQETLGFLRSYRASPPTVQVRLMVKPDNHTTVKLYRRLGFMEAGKCTLAEALVANGDGHLLPKDPDPVKYADRQGLIMISRISRP